MIGLVLAAGAGRRLRPYTDTLPKALVPVDGETTILDIALRNLAAVGLTDVDVVVGYAAERGRGAPGPDWRQRYGVTLTLVHNDKAEEWNNAYSLWLARDQFAGRARCWSTATPCTRSASRRPCWPNRGPGILLAVDDVKKLADEEMKTIFDDDGQLTRITKLMDPAEAFGEYIGATLIEASRGRRAGRRARGHLASATPSLYYEDGYQEYADRGGEVRAATDRRRAVGRGRQPRRPRPGAGDRMPLLARTRRTRRCTSTCGAARSPTWAAILADRRISAGGDVAVVVGPGQGERIAELMRPVARTRPTSSPSPAARSTPRSSSASEAARPVVRRGGRHRRRQDDRHRQVRGHPARACRWCRWRPAWPTTASPRRSPRLTTTGGKGSYGVHIPIAVVVDLDFVENGPDRQTAAGIGDVVSNLSALADWELARRESRRADRRAGRRRWPGSAPRRCSTTPATSATTVRDHAGRGADLQRPGDGGLRQSAGPASGGCHEISHAIDALFPGTGLARRAGRAGRAVLHLPARRRASGSPSWPPACAGTACPCAPADLGLTTPTSSSRRWRSRRGPGRTATRSSSTSTLSPDRDRTRKLAEYADALGDRRAEPRRHRAPTSTAVNRGGGLFSEAISQRLGAGVRRRSRTGSGSPRPP